MNNFIGNIVVTGATAKMPGVLELVSEVFGTQAVRQGIPSKLSGAFEEFTTVEYATAAGLLIVHGEMNDGEASPRRKKESRHRDHKMWNSLKNFVKEFF
jgi:cell division protein FtsA